MMNKYTYIGSYQQKSNKIFVSDPIFDKKSKNFVCEISNVSVGCWKSYINKDNTNHIISLMVIFDDFKYQNLKKNQWKEVGMIGVDSSTAGIYDYNPYDPEDVKEYTKINKLYYMLPYGTISESGYGDGIYSVYIYQHNIFVIGVKIIFVNKIFN